MKKLLYTPGLQDIKSIHCAGVRSIPKAQRSSYLDLYTLAREKERAEKEASLLNRKRISAHRRLRLINERMETLRKEIFEKDKGDGPKHTFGKKPFKKMAVKY